MFRAIDEIGEWRQQMKKIRDLAKQRPVLIGLVGSTGVGKSTLINALLDFRHLLPSSASTATTSVAMKVSWNASEKEDEFFRAEIEHLSLPKWQEELQHLLGDVHSYSKAMKKEDSDDDDDDLEATEKRAKDAIEKIRSVYQHLTADVLAKMSVDETIAGEPEVRKQLGLRTRIHCGKNDQELFTTKFRPFIDGTPSPIAPGRKCVLSTLVKSVNIFVRSPHLEGGMVVVDLPGVSDTNTTRCNIAEDFRSKLDRKVVLARAVRAADDKSSLDLLSTEPGDRDSQLLSAEERNMRSSVHERNLLMDGTFTDEHLCYFITLIDSSAEIFHLMGEYRCIHEKYADQIQELKRLRETKKNVDTLTERKKKLESSQANPRKKRRTTAGSSDSIVQVQAKINELLVMPSHQLASMKKKEHYLPGELKEKIKDKEHFLAHKYIAARHEIQSQYIKQIFLEIAKSEKAQSDLPVFSVSAPAFYSLKGAEPKLGLTDKASTGIPGLQKWCQEATLSRREEQADVFLRNIEMLRNIMEMLIFQGDLT